MWFRSLSHPAETNTASSHTRENWHCELSHPRKRTLRVLTPAKTSIVSSHTRENWRCEASHPEDLDSAGPRAFLFDNFLANFKYDLGRESWHMWGLISKTTFKKRDPVARWRVDTLDNPVWLPVADVPPRKEHHTDTTLPTPFRSNAEAWWAKNRGCGRHAG